MTLNVFYTKLKSLDTDKVAVDSVVETKEEIATLNTEQINSGLRSDGSEILPSYTNTTIFLKQLKGQETSHVTLKDEGDFYRGIRTDVSGDIINIDSSDFKTTKLKKKYETSKGKIFGLSKDFKIEYIAKSLRPAFNKKIEQHTGLKITR